MAVVFCGTDAAGMGVCEYAERPRPAMAMAKMMLREFAARSFAMSVGLQRGRIAEESSITGIEHKEPLLTASCQ
jgi:hypothetical protein